MPIVEKDPWREQYFASVECPDDVWIPTDDELAWTLYPARRWIYDKLAVAESQGLACAPHGITPESFPLFSKPIVNLRGMGTGGRILTSLKEYERALQPGHMWMPLLTGEHVSTDVAVRSGEPAWWRHTTGLELGGGTFNYWTVEADRRPDLEAGLSDWIGLRLGDYTGCLNLETIGGTIIEGHLRFADQWPDLYGAGWIEAVVRLYADGVWEYPDDDRRTGYSVVLFGGHRIRYRIPPGGADPIRARPGIASVQITFHPDRPLKTHAMPPGGFRLAIVNCWELEAGLEAREALAEMFLRATEAHEAGRHMISRESAASGGSGGR